MMSTCTLVERVLVQKYKCRLPVLRTVESPTLTLIQVQVKVVLYSCIDFGTCTCYRGWDNIALAELYQVPFCTPFRSDAKKSICLGKRIYIFSEIIEIEQCHVFRVVTLLKAVQYL